MNAGPPGRCCGCGAELPETEGPTHAYMLSSPACWARYGEVLAAEYADAALFGRVHRLTVDAYAVQHPGDPGDRRAVQSVWLHFAALYLVLAEHRPAGEAVATMKRLAGRDFPPLPSPPARFGMTVAEVEPGGPLHEAHVRRWARSAFEDRQALLEPVRALLRAG